MEYLNYMLKFQHFVTYISVCDWRMCTWLSRHKGKQRSPLVQSRGKPRPALFPVTGSLTDPGAQWQLTIYSDPLFSTLLNYHT